jgi:hypothetical protein
VRKHLDVDAGLVHLAQAKRAHVFQPLAQRPGPRLGAAFLPMARDLGIEVVLLQCDYLRLHSVLST